MKRITAYLKQYFFDVDKTILLLSSLFIAAAIFINYYFKMEKAIAQLPFVQKYLAWFFIFLVSFVFPYALVILRRGNFINDRKFALLLVIAPAIFAWKLSMPVHFYFSGDDALNKYWNYVAYWPFKLLVVVSAVWITWKLFEKDQPFYGCTIKDFNAKPYLLMLLIMAPLIAAASTQQDFLSMYPKLKNVAFLVQEKNAGIYKLLYELSYGSDFLSIEIFFRGFLILGFVKWVGKDAILPMALFYCTIHFGKPLGECISSYFGGIILGVITYHTQTIFGGLMVHLGIAWMMELGGYIGSTLVHQN